MYPLASSPTSLMSEEHSDIDTMGSVCDGFAASVGLSRVDCDSGPSRLEMEGI